MIVRPHYGGRSVRLRFSNIYGSAGQAITLSDVHIGIRKGESADIVAGSQRALTFSGSTSVQLAAGDEIVSDPTAFTVEAFQDIAVSFHIPGSTGPGSMHTDAHQTTYVSSASDGNHAADEAGTFFTQEKNSWYYFTGLEVAAHDADMAVVVLGDSLSDGSSSFFNLTTDPYQNKNGRWPDVLAQRVAQAGLPISILNAAIAGNRVLNDALLNVQPEYPLAYGYSALHRLDRDVLNQAGVATVIVLEGINDIGIPLLSTPPSLPVSADQLIAGYREIIQRAHARGLCVIGSTLTPTTFLLHGEPLGTGVRTAVNEWIRSSGAWDVVIDFDAVVRDPGNPQQIRPEFNAGDGLHMSLAGYQAMGNAVDLSSLTCQPKLP